MANETGEPAPAPGVGSFLSVDERIPEMIVEPLALRGREAAKALGISERSMSRLKADGALPFVRVGSAILFDVDDIKAWLKGNKEREVQTTNNA